MNGPDKTQNWFVPPLVHRQRWVDGEYQINLVIADTVAIEIKVIEQLRPVDDAQLGTFATKRPLTLNFDSPLLDGGIPRLVL